MRLLTCLFSFVLLYNASYANAVDSVIVPASTRYQHPSLLNRILVGKNYRDIWSLPVKMDVFHITTEKGGFVVTKLGGGMQTKSLHLKDKDSIEWVLRTVDKDVEKAMPAFLRKTFAKKIVQDMISSAHPYAPLSVAPLAKALGVIEPQPELFFVPDDPALGKYRSIFANTVCMLERKNPAPDNEDSKSTETLLEKLKDKQDQVVDDTTLLKARLLDMLIADWDRHSTQWDWAVSKRGKNTLYTPIALDRDQAYFLSKGMLVKIVRLFTLHHFVGFRKSDKRLIKLNGKSWSFDQLLLNRLDEEDWRRIIAEFQKTLNDSTIVASVLQFPPEVFRKDGSTIIDKLKSRRDGLMKYGMKYYSFLSQKILINGTNQSELFRISGNSDELVVTVYDSSSKKILYRRTFNNHETKEIQLNLLGGDDEFIVDKEVSSPIKIILSGGAGKDSYDVKGKMDIKADDKTKEEMKNQQSHND